MCVAGLRLSRRDRTYLWKTINTILSTINYCTTRVGGCVDKYHNRYRDRNVYEMLKLLLSYFGNSLQSTCLKDILRKIVS